MTPANERELGVLVRMVASDDPQRRDIALRAIRKIPSAEVTEYLASRKPDEKTSGLITQSLQESESDPVPTAQQENHPDNDKELTLTQRVQFMTVGEKIKLAFKGDKESRTLLLKDTNREIYMSVLENPGLKETEVEMITKNTATNADILRAIGKNREWSSNRNIMRNLVRNSKTPVELSIRFLPRMNFKDLEFIAKSRNLPMAVRTNAKRLVSSKRKGR